MSYNYREESPMKAYLEISGFHKHLDVIKHTDHIDIAFMEALPNPMKHPTTLTLSKNVFVRFYNTGRINLQGETIFQPQ
jgi:hypothetical protein